MTKSISSTLISVAWFNMTELALKRSHKAYSDETLCWQQARMSGLKYFFPGRRCKRGHLARWYTSTKRCVICNVIDATESGKRRAQAHPYYMPTKPCKHGHLALKYTINGRCVECHRNSMAKYSSGNGRIGTTARTIKRRATKLNAGGSFTTLDFKRLIALQKHCHICGKRFTKKRPATIDHVIALANGGTNDRSNIALAHGDCNSGKHTKRTHLI